MYYLINVNKTLLILFFKLQVAIPFSLFGYVVSPSCATSDVRVHLTKSILNQIQSLMIAFPYDYCMILRINIMISFLITGTL